MAAVERNLRREAIAGKEYMMVETIVQAAGTALSAVESGIGVCVLGTAATAAAVGIGFRLAGYRLGLTCTRRESDDTDDDLSDYYVISEEEQAANAEYAVSSAHWNAMKKRVDAAKLDEESDQLARQADEMKKRRKQAERVAELDAIRAERKARKAAEKLHEKGKALETQTGPKNAAERSAQAQAGKESDGEKEADAGGMS